MTLHRFFDDILRNTPESVEEVVIEPNAEWHTVDRKYGSSLGPAQSSSSTTSPPAANPLKTEAEWQLPTPADTTFSPGSQYGSGIPLPTATFHAPSPVPLAAAATLLRVGGGNTRRHGSMLNGISNGVGSEIVILDSDDDEDERRISRELSRPVHNGPIIIPGQDNGVNSTST